MINRKAATKYLSLSRHLIHLIEQNLLCPAGFVCLFVCFYKQPKCFTSFASIQCENKKAFSELLKKKKISDFFLFRQKNPFGEYMFPKLTLDGPISINFSQNLEK